MHMMMQNRTFKKTINFPIVLRVVGWLLMIEAFFMVAPLLVSLLYGEQWIALYFLIAVVITLLVGRDRNNRRILRDNVGIHNYRSIGNY